MKLLIVRHADAGDSGEWARTGRPDEERPLSEKGRDQMKRIIPVLQTLVPSAEMIVTSPLVRAMETAEFVASAYPRAERVVSDTLVPEAVPAAFVDFMREHRDADVAIAVGHEPHLSTLITYLVTGREESKVEFKKAGACLLLFDKRVKAGAGVMRWLMGPKEMVGG